MTTARVIDTQRLSTLAHEYEREILQFFQDLSADGGSIERIRKEAERVHFDEIRCTPGERILARIGSGNHVVVMDAQSDPTGIAGMIYAAKLIHELGMYDEFTLWVAAVLTRRTARSGLAAEPAGCRHRACLRAIRRADQLVHPDERGRRWKGFWANPHPAGAGCHRDVRSALRTAADPPPIAVARRPGVVPAIGFGPGGDQERVPRAIC